jgi:hypothetical protein
VAIRSLVFASAVTSLSLFGTAHASVYVATENFDGATVNLSITTNATGLLNQSNITSWNIAIHDSAGSVDLTPLDSQVLLSGTLTATASKLSFNFSNSGLLLFEQTSIGDGGPFWCAQGGTDCFGTSSPALGVSTQFGENPLEQTPERGSVVIGTVSAVPEPSTWAMMILGFFGLGFMAYRRKQNGEALSAA